MIYLRKFVAKQNCGVRLDHIEAIGKTLLLNI